MNTLIYIIVATVAGGALSIVFAAMMAFTARPHWIAPLISLAIGALLGAAFLDILPHALEAADAQTVMLTVLAGILAFFVLEKLVLWRHCHVEDCEAHDPLPATAQTPDRGAHGDHGRSGLLILIGDSFHNFVDGVIIAAAFMESTSLGVVTATAIVAHEVPQEVGDFLILLHSGYSKMRAFALNLLSSFSMLVGALVAWFALRDLGDTVGLMLGLAAASMIYVAVADLIPGLHKRTELRATAQQVVMIVLGIFIVWSMGELTHKEIHSEAGASARIEVHAPGDHRQVLR